MAKDFTKYRIEGIAENLNKARLVQKVVTHYCDNENPDFEDLKLTWFDDLQGGKGVVRLLSEVDEKNARNYYVDAPIQLKDGSVVVVCNQWGKDNLANFVYLAGFHGYKIYAEGENVENPMNHSDSNIESPAINENSSSEKSNNPQIVTGSPDWELPEAISFVIRHMIISDDEILEGELNWMQSAFEEFDKENIDVRSVWDSIDDQARLYSQIGFYDAMFSNVIIYLNNNLTETQKTTLFTILMEICAVDGVVKHAEYVTLLVIAGLFYPGKEKQIIFQPFINAGMKVEEINDNISENINLPEQLLENLSQEEDIDANIQFIENHIAECQVSIDIWSHWVKDVLDIKPSPQIAAFFVSQLYLNGLAELALELMSETEKYFNENMPYYDEFLELKEELTDDFGNKRIKSKKFEDQDLKVVFNVYGKMNRVFLCTKEDDIEINDIEDHWENTYENFYQIDSDNIITCEINDEEVFNGTTLQLFGDRESYEPTEDIEYNEELRYAKLFLETMNKKIKELPGYQDLDFNNLSQDFYSKYSFKATNTIIIQDKGVKTETMDRVAPNFENRYTMVLSGKFHLRTYPLTLKSFRINDFFLRKISCLEDITGESLDSYYCFSELIHCEEGSLEFEIMAENIKDINTVEGWPSDY